MSAKVSIQAPMARRRIACNCARESEKGRSGALFLCRELAEEKEQLRTFGVGKPRSDAALVALDAPAQAQCQRSTARRQPQTVRAPVLAAPALDQAAFFERIDHAHHGRAVELHRLCESSLRNTGVGLD